MKPKVRPFTFVVILAAVCASLSCSLGAIGAQTQASATLPPPASSLAPATAPVETRLPAATAAPQPAATLPDAGVPTPSSDQSAPTASGLGDLAANSAAIDSFSMSVVYHAAGKDDMGSPYKEDFSFIEDSIKSQQAEHFKISGMTAMLGMSSGNLEIYQIGSSLYMVPAAQGGPNGACMALGNNMAGFDPNSLNPSALMKDLVVDQLLEKGVTVNGVKADHYTVKSSGLGFGSAVTQSGEVWLAQDGGYPVKFSGKADGAFDLVTTFTGSVTWSYDLTNVNQLTAIDLPPQCVDPQAPLTDLVFPSNATGLSQLAHMTIFSSPDKPGDVAAFFQQNLPAKGWTIDAVEQSSAATITLRVSKPGQKLQITITRDSTTGGCNVVITPSN